MYAVVKFKKDCFAVCWQIRLKIAVILVMSHTSDRIGSKYFAEIPQFLKR